MVISEHQVVDIYGNYPSANLITNVWYPLCGRMFAKEKMSTVPKEVEFAPDVLHDAGTDKFHDVTGNMTKP